jgi:DNA modification methylase
MSVPSNTPGKHDNVRLHVEYVDVARLQVRFRRTKSHSARQIKKLAGAIERTGFNVPILVDEDLTVVSGHGRLDAAKLLGISSVPVIRITHLTPAQLRLFAIFDNKIGTEGVIDSDAIFRELSDISVEAPDLDLSDSGFAIGEIDAMKGLHRTQELDDLDEAPEPPRKAVSHVGDLWLLGRHRLLCGDSTDAAQIARLIGGRPAQLLLSDPPYNLKIPGVVSGNGRVKHDNFVMASGELSPSEFQDFLSSFIAAAKPHLLDGALAMLFMDWRHIADLITAGTSQQLTHRQLLVWEKSNPAMGAIWRNAHELIAVFKRGDAPTIDNVALGKFGRNRSNVLHYPGANVPTKGRRRALELHSTVKPIALIADLILDVSNPGDLILDSFGGSGTTLMAANAVERDACVCELDPRYVDTIIERWTNRTGEEAILEASGESWSDVRSARLMTDEEKADA